MPSMIEICNYALGYLGEPPIASLEDKRPAAEYCRLYLPEALRSVLREHPWNFAQAREKLVLVSVPPAWSTAWRFAYAMPPKCVSLHFIIDGSGGRDERFTMTDTADRTIVLCNVPNATAHYTRLVDDASRYDPCFVQALARKIQAFVVKPLAKNNPSLVQEAETLYQRDLEAAKLQDAREGRRFQDASSPWDGGHDLWGDVVRTECGQ